jgi:hypothetical protein
MKRYFLITYIVQNSCYDYRGTLYFGYEGFPSKKWIKERIIERMCKGNRILHGDVAVMNIFEFKSVEDFDAFSREDD